MINRCIYYVWLISSCAAFTDYAPVTVEGVIGGSAVLPCISNKNELKPDNSNVRWRYKDRLNVCDMTKGKCSGENQDSAYKNRIEVTSDNYEKGNFSIKLLYLVHTDAGDYQCFIMHSNELVKVSLLIKENTESKVKTQTAAEQNHADGTKWMKILIPALCVFCHYAFLSLTL